MNGRRSHQKVEKLKKRGKNEGDEKENKDKEEKIKEMVSHIEGVSDEDRHRLYELLKENMDVFSTKPGRFEGVECHLDTYEHEPFREKERPIPISIEECRAGQYKKAA